MKNYVSISAMTATERAIIPALTKKFEDADYAVEIDTDDAYIIINHDTKGVYSSNVAEGTRLYSASSIEALLSAPPASEDPVEEAVEAVEEVFETKAYIVKSYAYDDQIGRVQAILEENGWTVTGNSSAPYINFHLEEKRATFATVATGERLFSEGAVLDFCGIELPSEPVPESKVETEVDDEEIILEEVADTDADADFEKEPELVFVGVPSAPAKKAKETKIQADGDGYRLMIETNNVVTIDVSESEANAVIG